MQSKENCTNFSHNDKELSDEKCKQLLEENGNKYTLEETRIIKQFLMELLKINIEQLTKSKS
jgi:hypothetical protein